MKIAHLADLHLGYRAYHRTKGRINLREADVARAFREAIDRIVELAPGMVLIAGDVFHSVRPPNASIQFAFNQVKRLDCPVVMVAGNHETPRSGETTNILGLFREIPNVQVFFNEAARYRHDGASVLCVSHNAVLMRPTLKPDPGARYNILLAHAAHAKYKLQARSGAHILHSDDIDPSEWDYVALGDYHSYDVIEPNMIYPGAIEYTSTNIWAEAGEPKGFVVYDLRRRTHEFVALESPRAVYDFQYDVAGMSAKDIDSLVAHTASDCLAGLEGKIVRIKLDNVDRQVERSLDHRKIQSYRSLAVHFHLDCRRPLPKPRQTDGDTAQSPRMTLEQELEDFLRNRFCLSSEDIDRDELIKLGLEYLAEAKEAEDKARDEEG